MAGKRKSNWLLNMIIVICAGVFVYAAVHLIQIMGNYAHNEKVQTQLQDMFYQTPVEESSKEPQEVSQSPATPHKTSGEKEESKESSELEAHLEIPQYNFTPLLELNEDIDGWLLMPAAQINYPVVQSYDNEDYLHTNIYGEYEYAGTLFLDYRCMSDDCRNLVIYGHNMNDGSMFGELNNYMNEDVGLENPYFWYITPDQVYRCDIISTYLTTIEEEYLRFDFIDDDDYMDYIDYIIDNSWYEFPEVTVSRTDKIISLSTCNYTFTAQIVRQVLFARMTPVNTDNTVQEQLPE